MHRYLIELTEDILKKIASELKIAAEFRLLWPFSPLFEFSKKSWALQLDIYVLEKSNLNKIMFFSGWVEHQIENTD